MREEEIEDMVRIGGSTKKAVLKRFVNESRGKVGVREKIEEVIARRCSLDRAGHLVWNSEE